MVASQSTRPPEEDLVDLLGPLASMHAALDAAGIGQPCAVVAKFEGVTVQAVETALLEVAERRPLLNRRLVYASGRPVLVASSGPVTAAREARLLDFSARRDRRLWTWRVHEEAGGAWLEAAFAHAIADGLSMLRLVRAVSDRLGSPMEADRLWQSRSAQPRGSQALWTGRFLFDQLRLARSPVVSARRPPCTGAWTHLDAVASLKLLERAGACGGVAGLLSAASLLTMAQDEGRTGLQPLEVPVARRDLRAFNGFGFGVGALLLPTVVRRGDPVDSLANQIAGRLRSAIEKGWDMRLERFLGRDPRRHARFAAHHLRHPGQGPLTVSWKGSPLWKGDRVLGDVACFSASTNLHVSAHGDGRGLSLSATGPFEPDRTRRLLIGILDQLKTSPTGPIHALDVMPPGEAR